MAQQQIDFDPNVDYYKALGVDSKATADEIKKAYRKLAKANHPDSTGGDKKKESRFKDISNAYDVLGDEKKKTLYDQIRAGGGNPFGGGGNPFAGGNPFGGQGRQRAGYANSAGSVFDLGDLFNMFNQSQGAPGARSHRVEFEDEPRQRRRAPEDAEFESKVKAADGTWLDAKDLDVYSDVRIAFDRAILGTVATVATVDGKAEVKIPPGTASGKKLRLRGKGLPDRSGTAGDHYITVQIDVPKDLDEEDKKLLAQLVNRLRKQKPNG
ncbi:MAG TPA: DnaJ domain-containing protein [Kofleriaceae bacterium]|jgi:molecular chaperone DnaJ